VSRNGSGVAPFADLRGVVLVVNERNISLTSEDVERLLAGLLKITNSPSALAWVAGSLATRLENASEIAGAVRLRPSDDLVLLNFLTRLDLTSQRLERLENALEDWIPFDDGIADLDSDRRW
jgi:hypothetical protein